VSEKPVLGVSEARLLFLWADFTMDPEQRLVAPESILSEDELEARKETVGWLVQEGWIELSSTDLGDLVTFTAKAEANRDEIFKRVGELHSR
jgi:hypothetical protein